jgi:drug/metabolite transporter, DME family
MLALSAAGILWGTLGLVVRLLQDVDLPTIVIAFWRLVLATAVLGVLVGPAGLRVLRGEARRPWRLVAVGLAFAVFQLSYFVGVKEAGVAVATLVTLGIAPVAAAVVESVRDRRGPSALTVVTVGGAVAGLALVSTSTDPVAAPRPGLGLLMSVVSGLAYTTSAFVSAPLSRRMGAFTITAATSAVALVVMTPFALATGVAVPLTPKVVGGLLWLGLVTTALAYGLFYAGLRTTPGSVAMVLTLLEPATAVVLAVVVLGEATTPAGVAGTLLLIGAVAALYLAPARPAPATSAPPA